MFVRVPAADWLKVKHGAKTEFRGQPGRSSAFHFVDLPTPAVAWTLKAKKYESVLVVLEAVWQEQLGAISKESLHNEGFGTLTEFRRYWMTRERRRFLPLAETTAYRFHLMTTYEQDEHARRLLEHLYGQWL